MVSFSIVIHVVTEMCKIQAKTVMLTAMLTLTVLQLDYMTVYSNSVFSLNL